MRQGRQKAAAQRAWGRTVGSTNKTSRLIDELSKKRGCDSARRLQNFLRQQRDKYKEIVDFYRTRPCGSLDKRAKDFVVLIATGNGSDKLIKIISQKARSVIKEMILRRVSERAGYNQLVRLEKSGVFRVVTFDLTSSEGSKRHKEKRNREIRRKNPEKILVIEPGETEAAILEKLRTIEGII